MNQKILIFRHSKSCPPGTTTKFFEKKSMNYDIHFWPEATQLPILENYMGLIVLGGPQNVDQENQFPWLKEEKQLIQQFLKLNRPYLGICLGAQLLAEVLGADVRRHIHDEAGWKNIEIDTSVSALLPAQISSREFFQWHGYRFLTPTEAKRFATNEITSDQGFVYRENVVAVQFHPEADAVWIRQHLDDPNYPKLGPYVQTADKLTWHSENLGPAEAWYFELLENLFMKHLSRA